MIYGSNLDPSKGLITQTKAFVENVEKRKNQERLLNDDQVRSMRAEGDNLFFINEETGAQANAVSGGNIYPLHLTSLQMKYLKDRPKAQQEILQKLRNNGFVCNFAEDLQEVHIENKSQNSSKHAVKRIQKSVIETTIPLSVDQLMYGTITDGACNVETDEFGVLVVKDGNTVKFVGMAPTITQMSGSLRESMKCASTEETKEKKIPVNENRLAYLQTHKWDELVSLAAEFPGVVLTPDRSNIKINGPSSGVDAVTKMIEEELDRLRTVEIDLGSQTNVGNIAQLAQKISRKHKCAFALCQKQEMINPPQVPLETRMHSSLSISVAFSKREIAVSGPGNIKTCKAIFHGSLPDYPKDTTSPTYNKQEENCYKWMVSTVFNCLIMASEKGYRTVAFPALGTGLLDYPVQHVVQLMYKAVRLYNEGRQSGPGAIKEVIIVIYPTTKLQVKQLFLAHRQTHKLKTQHVATIYKVLQERKKDNGGNFEIRAHIDQNLLQVVNSNIYEACDVTESVVVLWTERYIQRPETNPSLKCTDPNKPDWKCSAYISSLPETLCVVDRTTYPGRTFIHSYCEGATETEALVQGLKTAAAKVKCNTITIPIPFEGRMANKPKLLPKW